MEKIIVTIGPNGEIDIEGKEFKGKTCDAAIDPLAEELGITVNKKRKAEYYQRTSNVKRKRIGGR